MAGKYGMLKDNKRNGRWRFGRIETIRGREGVGCQNRRRGKTYLANERTYTKVRFREKKKNVTSRQSKNRGAGQGRAFRAA